MPPCLNVIQSNGERIPNGRGIVGHVARTRELVRTDKLDSLHCYDPEYDALPEVSAPIVVYLCLDALVSGRLSPRGMRFEGTIAVVLRNFSAG